MSFKFERADILKDPEKWNQLVLSLPVESYHIGMNPSLGLVFQSHFDFPPEYYYAFDNQELIALIPGVRSGNRFISLPISSYGGFLVLKTIDIDELYKQFFAFINCDYEVRSNKRISQYCYDQKVNSHLFLKGTIDDQLAYFDSKVRNHIKKGIKNGLELRVGGKEMLLDFYQLYCRNMHFLGTPVPSINYFEAFLENYKFGKAKVFAVIKDGNVLASGLYFSYGQYAENFWSATNRKFNHLNINSFLVWEMMKYAIQDGCRIFSFGRSTKESSVLSFKEQWNVVVTPIYFNYPKVTKNIRNKKWMAAIWKRLPFKFTLVLGPLLRKKLLA